MTHTRGICRECLGGTIVARLNDLTPEDIGGTATREDLEEFKSYAQALMDRDGLTDAEAIEALWSSPNGMDGDYYANAQGRGLIDA